MFTNKQVALIIGTLISAKLNLITSWENYANKVFEWLEKNNKNE